jgi:hypothetical protein
MKKIGILKHKTHGKTVVHVIDHNPLKKQEYHHHTVCGLKKHKIDYNYNFEEKIDQIYSTVNDECSTICDDCVNTGNKNAQFLIKFFTRRK